MNGDVKVLYNGVNVFSGICPSPFLFFEKEYIEYGSSWGSKYNFTIEGQITGRLGPQSYFDIEDKKNRLISGFLQDNLPLSIIEDGVNIFNSDICSVQSISFDESKYYALLPFSITASCYDSGSFADNYGVLNPTDSWDFSEEKDGTVSVTHSVSAAGFNSSGVKAINNAKKWVNSRTGVSNKVETFKIKNISGSCFVLDSISERIDRFNGSYSIEEKYKADLFSGMCGPGILRYSIDVSKNFEDGITQVNIDGSAIGKNQVGLPDLADLRNRVLSYNFFSDASEAADKTTGSKSLNAVPFSRKITENENASEVSFSFSYDDNPIPPGVAKCVYKATFSEDLIKNIIDVKLDAKITCDRGDISVRWDAVNDYYKKVFNPYSLAVANYTKAGYSKGFSDLPVSENINFDKFNAVISYSASWSDRYLPCSQTLVAISETVSITPSLYIYTAQPSLQQNGVYNIQNIGSATRTSVSISIDATARPDKTLADLKSCVYAELERLKSIYVKNVNLFTDEKTETVDKNYKKISLNYTYSFDGDVITF
jgi:hypothetical protein